MVAMRWPDGKVVDRRRKKQLRALERENAEAGSNRHSDALKSYDGRDREYVHQVIDHAEAYVDGQVNTNGLENFSIFLKRGIDGERGAPPPVPLRRRASLQFQHAERRDF
jgi:hypothetical protein